MAQRRVAQTTLLAEVTKQQQDKIAQTALMVEVTKVQAQRIASAYLFVEMGTPDEAITAAAFGPRIQVL